MCIHNGSHTAKTRCAYRKQTHSGFSIRHCTWSYAYHSQKSDPDGDMIPIMPIHDIALLSFRPRAAKSAENRLLLRLTDRMNAYMGRLKGERKFLLSDQIRHKLILHIAVLLRQGGTIRYIRRSQVQICQHGFCQCGGCRVNRQRAFEALAPDGLIGRYPPARRDYARRTSTRLPYSRKEEPYQPDPDRHGTHIRRPPCATYEDRSPPRCHQAAR